MEQIVGKTLRELLDEKIRRKERRRYALELVDALSYLHSINVVHRDLKPSNIMVTKNGQTLKLIDFGLSDSDDYAILKQSAGTRAYMAPEQWRGRRAGAAADQYALAATAYELLAGFPPFEAEDRETLRLAVLNEAGLDILRKVFSARVTETAVPQDPFMDRYPCIWKQGDRYILINFGETDRNFTVPSDHAQKELWTEKTLEPENDCITVSLRPHESAVLLG
jgi:serine/threonine protein kinase